MNPFELKVLDSNYKVIHNPFFPTMEELNNQIKEIQEQNSWNFPTKQVLQLPPDEIIPAIPAVMSDDGLTEITPAIPEQVIEHPSYYTTQLDVMFEIVDHSEEYAALALKLEAKEAKRLQRIENLKTIDWKTVDSIAKIKPILKVLVEDFLKDLEE